MTSDKRYDDINIDDGNNNAESTSNDTHVNFRVETPAIVFCIDGREQMTANVSTGSETCPLLTSLKCVRHVVRSYITSSARCSCAVMLTGCDKTENTLNLKNIVMLSPMSLVGGDTMKNIDQLCEDVKDGSYNRKYGFGSLSLSNTFWSAATVFSQMKNKSKKKIMLFTNDDNPCKDDRTEKKNVITKLADFEKLKIKLCLMAIGEKFNYSTFYKELLQFSGEVTELQAALSVDDLISQCDKVKARHVALASIPFRLSDDYIINVSVHNIVRRAKTPSICKLSTATNQVVTSKLRTYDEETGEEVKPENLLKYETMGKQNICFTMDELKNINDIAERGLRLLGFKPKNQLSFENHVKPGAFIYPSETTLKGGSAVFQALLQKCEAKNKVAICTYCPRATSGVRYVALEPQLEETDPTGTQVRPPGFRVTYLPFGDEVRNWNNECTDKKRATPKQVDVMKEIVKKLRIPYKPEAFPNPQLAHHWASVEAILFDLPEMERTRDETVPDDIRINGRLGDLTERFHNEIYSEGYFVGQAQPKSKPSNYNLAVDFAAIEEMARNDELNRLKVDQLKDYLKQVGLHYGLSKMKKPDVIARIKQHLKL